MSKRQRLCSQQTHTATMAAPLSFSFRSAPPSSWRWRTDTAQTHSGFIDPFVTYSLVAVISLASAQIQHGSANDDEKKFGYSDGDSFILHRHIPSLHVLYRLVCVVSIYKRHLSEEDCKFFKLKCFFFLNRLIKFFLVFFFLVGIFHVSFTATPNKVYPPNGF